MSKLILWGSSALDFYQHGDFTSLLTLWLDIAHQEDITPNAAAVQYLEDRLPWLSKPFRIIVPSRQQKRKNPPLQNVGSASAAARVAL